MLLKIEPSEITPFFYNNFFGFRGISPLSPLATPLVQVGNEGKYFNMNQSIRTWILFQKYEHFRPKKLIFSNKIKKLKIFIGFSTFFQEFILKIWNFQLVWSCSPIPENFPMKGIVFVTLNFWNKDENSCIFCRILSGIWCSIWCNSSIGQGNLRNLRFKFCVFWWKMMMPLMIYKKIFEIFKKISMEIWFSQLLTNISDISAYSPIPMDENTSFIQ